MNKQEATRIIKENLGVLSREYGVSRVGFFGSIVRDDLRDDSDLDLVVEFDKPIGFGFVRLVEYLETLFGRKVDILTKTGLDNIRVQEVAQTIQKDLVYV